ncbi:MAG: nitroreductase family protein, partial [Thermotogota bacterium]|nr:nitroreductase family protein [Thermotogota bacterium]
QERKIMRKNIVIDTLMKRRSVRKFRKQIPDDETIETIVRVGQQAPFTSQLYSVIFGTEGDYGFGAPLWFLICIDAYKLERYMRLRHLEIEVDDLSLLLLGIQDASYLAENMVIAAESLGLGSCFLGEGSINPYRVRQLTRLLNLPPRVLPAIELVMGFPDEDRPIRPRYPLAFTLFENGYPELTDTEVIEAMSAMDGAGSEKQTQFAADPSHWTEHIVRKWCQWSPSQEDLLEALSERGFHVGKPTDESKFD